MRSRSKNLLSKTVMHSLLAFFVSEACFGKADVSDSDYLNQVCKANEEEAEVWSPSEVKAAGQELISDFDENRLLYVKSLEQTTIAISSVFGGMGQLAPRKTCRRVALDDSEQLGILFQENHTHFEQSGTRSVLLLNQYKSFIAPDFKISSESRLSSIQLEELLKFNTYLFYLTEHVGLSNRSTETLRSSLLQTMPYLQLPVTSLRKVQQRKLADVLAIQLLGPSKGATMLTLKIALQQLKQNILDLEQQYMGIANGHVGPKHLMAYQVKLSGLFFDSAKALSRNALMTSAARTQLKEALTGWRQSLQEIEDRICEAEGFDDTSFSRNYLLRNYVEQKELEYLAKKAQDSSVEGQSEFWPVQKRYLCTEGWGQDRANKPQALFKSASVVMFLSSTALKAGVLAGRLPGSINKVSSGVLVVAALLNAAAHVNKFQYKLEKFAVVNALSPDSSKNRLSQTVSLASEVLLGSIYSLGMWRGQQALTNILVHNGNLQLGQALLPLPQFGSSFADWLSFWSYNVSTTLLSALEFHQSGVNPFLKPEFYIGTFQEYLTSILFVAHEDESVVMTAKSLARLTARSAIAAYVISSHFEDMWVATGAGRSDQALSRFEAGYHGSGISLALRYGYYMTLYWLPKVWKPALQPVQRFLQTRIDARSGQVISRALRKPVSQMVPYVAAGIDFAYQMFWAEVYNQLRVKYLENPKYAKFPFGIWSAFKDTSWVKAVRRAGRERAGDSLSMEP